MTRVDIDRLSPRHQAFIRKQAHVSEQHKKPRPSKPIAFGEEFDSQLEVDFAGELEIKKATREISEWHYHPLRFRIGKNVTYTPDFLTAEPSTCDWADRFTIYEVKGSWESKNARDSRTRLQVAAYMYQFFSWQAVTREKGIWHYETVHSTEALQPMD